MLPTKFSYEFNSGAYTGNVNFPTGIFINGKFSPGNQKKTIE